MSAPENKEDVFRLIYQAPKDTGAMYSQSIKYGDFVEEEIKKYRQLYPFMEDVTKRQYYDYRRKALADKYRAELAKPAPTAAEFWNAAYSYNNFGGPADANEELTKITCNNKMDAIPLGNYCGHAKLELILAMSSLPITDYTSLTNFGYATADGAISYPDGHPSETREDDYKVKASQDKRLRRFLSLGHVIHTLPDGTWSMTGHSLVIDLDETRDHHPWFVLASEWPSKYVNAAGDSTICAPFSVDRDDAYQPGVLPGGHNRTVLGMVLPMVESSSLPVLKQFGPDFNFVIKRPGGERSYNHDPDRGPDLARIMEWYWDPTKEEEVCYYKKGMEYMRYNPRTKYYSYPDMNKLRTAVIGEAGMFGVLAGIPAPARDFVPLTQRQERPPDKIWGRHQNESSIIEAY